MSCIQSISWPVFVVVACLISLSANPEALAQKHQGTWVKAQGYLSGSKLRVEKINQRAIGGPYILEGLVNEDKGTADTYRIANIPVVPQADAQYTFINGQPARGDDVRPGTRIKAIGAFDHNEFRAREVRIFQYSDDDDIEVEGPIYFVEQHNEELIYRVGALLLSSNDHELHQQRSGTRPASAFSRLVQLSGKVKLSDNNRAADIPAENLAGDSRRYGKLQTTLRSRFLSSIQFYSRLEVYWRDRFQSELDPSVADGLEFRLRDLYLSIDDPGGLKGLRFRFGRQRFRDARTWLMDARLDAVQVAYRRSQLGVAFAASRTLGERTTHADQLHYIASAYGRFGRILRATFYAIKENDERSGRDDALWLAFQLRGRTDFMEWWAQGASYSSRSPDLQRQGYGLDAGAIIRPLGRRRGPFLSYHYGWGSADNPATTTTRERFRQPHLQINYYKYGSSRRIYYYGRLMSPELSNLRFQAVGAGYRFSRRLTVQSIVRSYQQIRASRLQRGSNLGITPDGQHSNLGRSLEALVDLFPLRPLQVTLSAEWFLPGDAFAPSQSTVFGLGSEVVFYF